MNYNNKRFVPITNTENGESDERTIFEYKQEQNTITATYKGGKVVSGHMIGIVNEMGIITSRYHHLSTDGTLKSGACISTPEILPNGKIRLHEKWRWTSGNCSTGESIVEEI